jgi:hypothetical protein
MRKFRPHLTAKLADAIEFESLTLAQIALQLRVHSDVPRRWIMKGRRLKDGTVVRLEALRIPGAWRVRPEALERFLKILAGDQIPNEQPAARGRPPKQSQHDAEVDARCAKAGI